MSVDRRLVNMGVFLLILGGIPLAVARAGSRAGRSRRRGSCGAHPDRVGLGLILRRTPFHFVGGLLVAATFGTILGAVLAGGLGSARLAAGAGPSSPTGRSLINGARSGTELPTSRSAHVRQPVGLTGGGLRWG